MVVFLKDNTMLVEEDILDVIIIRYCVTENVSRKIYAALNLGKFITTREDLLIFLNKLEEVSLEIMLARLTKDLSERNIIKQQVATMKKRLLSKEDLRDLL